MMEFPASEIAENEAHPDHRDTRSKQDSFSLPPSSPPPSIHHHRIENEPATDLGTQPDYNVDEAHSEAGEDLVPTQEDAEETPYLNHSSVVDEQLPQGTVAASTAVSTFTAHSSMMPPPLPPPSKYNPPSTIAQTPVASQKLALQQRAPPPHLPSSPPEAQSPDVEMEDQHTPNRDAQQSNDADAAGPEDDLETFDWEDLERRYHHRVNDLNIVQDKVMEEFTALCDYFAVWAEVGANHEIDRSFKRLKTQMSFVRHHEGQLEQRREHYVKVVNAFKSALELLACH